MARTLLKIVLPLALLQAIALVQATAIPATAAAAMLFNYEGIHLDNETGESYALYVRKSAPSGFNHSEMIDHENPPKLGHLNHGQVNRPNHLENSTELAAYKRDVPTEADKYATSHGWTQCEIYDKPKNYFGCHHKNSYFPYARDVGEIQFKKDFYALMWQAFGDFNRPAQNPRSICAALSVHGHRFCISWYRYFHGPITKEVIDIVYYRIIACNGRHFSGQGWVRFRDGEDHVICFSDKPLGCQKTFCWGMMIVGYPDMHFPLPDVWDKKAVDKSWEAMENMEKRPG